MTTSVTVVAAALLGIDLALAAGDGKDTAAITRGALGLASGRHETFTSQKKHLFQKITAVHIRLSSRGVALRAQ